ncbi:MAG TPA: TIGR04255 family protein [Bryobacteraceae bacterium]|nr:TIGR04255 family protein [Bryobacteraceae bacterium]
MMARPDDLPNFRSPPVTEVYLSIQFEPIAGIDGTFLKGCCVEFADQFPQIRFQQPLGHDLEVFSGQPSAPPAFQFQFGGSPDINVRLALASRDGERLLQIQNDRFVHNWRKQDRGIDYPRYESIRKGFESHTRAFLALIARAGLTDPIIDQCEISYINRIEASTERGGYAGAERVFSRLRVPDARDSLPALEDLGFRARYILADENQRPFGRLHTLVQPAMHNRTPDFQFTLLARGRPMSPTLDGALNFFDAGRRTIVCAFAALTTPEMHKVWGRTDVAT